MNFKDIEKILRKDGWELKTVSKSSHYQFIHPIKKGKVTLAYHGSKDISIKILKSICLQAGIKFPPEK